MRHLHNSEHSDNNNNIQMDTAVQRHTKHLLTLCATVNTEAKKQSNIRFPFAPSSTCKHPRFLSVHMFSVYFVFISAGHVREYVFDGVVCSDAEAPGGSSSACSSSSDQQVLEDPLWMKTCCFLQTNHTTSHDL